MSEAQWKCSYYPDCMIHTGEPAPRRFTAENVAEMREMRAEGAMHKEIAQKFGCHITTVADILRGRTHRSA